MINKKHTIDDVRKTVRQTANKDLTDLMQKTKLDFTDVMKTLLDTNQKVVEWFYTPLQGSEYQGKTPYEICKKGGGYDLYQKAMDVLTAAHGQ